jgi:endonuclease YncB( thermonuclease family)
MKRTILWSSITIAALALCWLFLQAPRAQAGDPKDCADFQSQAAAQRWFLRHDPQADPAGLDGDHDGVACEDNPCPCGTEGGGGTGGGGDGHHTRLTRHAKVASITDGDTIRVTLRHTPGSRPVRLIGIDTPEVYEQTECGGPRASRAMKHLLHPGQRIALVRDPSQANTDRYGRLLRYVERRGIDVGQQQIRHGWAHVYVYHHSPFKRVRRYRGAQDKARHRNLGAWKLCNGHF